MIKAIAALAVLLSCQPLLAQAPREMSRKVRNTHLPISTQGLTLEQSRLAILNGMLNNKGIKWAYEGETANCVRARWDYRFGSVIFRIVYDENQIQTLYESANKNYECTDLSDGVCHAAKGRYFNFMPHLRKAIDRQVRIQHRALKAPTP